MFRSSAHMRYHPNRKTILRRWLPQLCTPFDPLRKWISRPCCTASVMPRLSSWVRQPTERRNSTGCESAFLRNSSRKKDFTFVAIEGDWPDAARIDHYVRHFEYPPSEWTAFARFPRWMWRNNEVRAFVDWMRKDNASKPPQRRTAFYGLDLYSLYTSIGEVLRYLDRVDPETAGIARHRYGCLTPWQNDPAAYGHAALTGAYRTCETSVVSMLRDILTKQNLYMARDGERYNDVVQNARLVANAERYYRIMYYGSRASWNFATAICLKPCSLCSPFMDRQARLSSGRTTPMLEMRQQPRCQHGGKPTLENFAEGNSAIRSIR